MMQSSTLSTGLLLPTSHGVGLAKLFFHLLQGNVASLFPSKCGVAEPLKNKVKYEQLEEILAKFWGKHFYWANEKSKLMGIWSVTPEENSFRHSTVFMHGKQIPFDPLLLTALYRMLSDIAPIDYGYFHALGAFETHYLFDNIYKSYEDYNSGVVTVSLRKGLPDLAWATVFGEPYVNMIGLDRLLSAPCYRIERWNDKVVYLQLTEHIAQIEENHDLFNKIRKQAMEHIGFRYFLSMTDSPITPLFIIQ